MTWLLHHFLGLLWTLTGLGFAALIAFSVIVARARSQRLFVDEPTQRVRALHTNRIADHTKDWL